MGEFFRCGPNFDFLIISNIQYSENILVVLSIFSKFVIFLVTVADVFIGFMLSF